MIGPDDYRLLHRHPAYGYTQSSVIAMRHELPPLTEAEQDELTRMARSRETRAWETSRRRILGEIEHLAAHVHDPHVARTVRAIRRELEALHEKLSR